MGSLYIENDACEAEGDLKIGIQNGLLLSGNNNFYLQVGASPAAADNYDSKPSMWDISLANDIDGTKDAIQASLSGNKITNLDLNGTNEVNPIKSSTGWISIDNLDPSVQTGGFFIYLSVTDANVPDLITGFTANGYTATTSDVDGYDIKISVLASQFTAGTSYLIYDFRDITSESIEAKVNGIHISTVSLKSSTIFRLR